MLEHWPVVHGTPARRTNSWCDLLVISIDCWPEEQVLPEGPVLPLALSLEDAVVEVAVVEGAGAAVLVGMAAGGVVVVVWPTTSPVLDGEGT